MFKNKLKVEPGIFIPSIIAVIAFCLWVWSDPDRANDSLLGAYAFITDQLLWLFEWIMLIFLGLCLYFAFSPYGKKKLGDEEPEFSTLSWLGMIFTGVAGLGILTWGTIEVYYYMETPPFGIAPFSDAAKPWALSYPMFHWGFTAYGIYTFLGLIFAYLFFVKKKDVVRPSSACEPLLSKKTTEGWVGKVIDVLFVFGLIGGIATSFGVNVPTMFAIISQVFGVEHTLGLDAMIIMSWTVFMAILLYFGLKKGLKLLSDVRVYFAFALLGFILIFGPTSYFLNHATDTMGHLFSNSTRMALNADPYYQSRVPQDWTIFYYAWYVALALQSAIFYGRISRGRTVRQFILGTLLVATVAGWLFFMIFSNFTMYVLESGTVDVSAIMASGGQGAAIVSIWMELPFARILMPLLMIYAYISMQTFLNGGTYTLAMVTSKVSSSEVEPPVWVRIFWSIALGSIAIALVYMGGIKVAQSMTIVASLPSLVIIALVCGAFFKDIKNTWGKEIAEEKAKFEEYKQKNS